MLKPYFLVVPLHPALPLESINNFHCGNSLPSLVLKVRNRADKKVPCDATEELVPWCMIELLIGTPTKPQALPNPPNTLLDTKWLIGRRFGDAQTQKEMKVVPFSIVKAPNGDAWVEANRQQYFPSHISAFVLTKMKEIAKAYMGKADEPGELRWNNPWDPGVPGQKWDSIGFCSPLVHERPRCRHPTASSLTVAIKSESMSTHTTTMCLLPPPWLSMLFPFTTHLTIALSRATTMKSK
ncbi:Heat shock protein, mitochondrial [Glycine soja]